jgi:hypothetical protein
MPDIMTCTQCAKKLKVPDSASGKKVRCPSCKAVIAVPAPEKLVEPDDFVEPEKETAVTEAPAPKKKAVWEKDSPDSDKPLPETTEAYGLAKDDENERNRGDADTQQLDADDEDERKSRKKKQNKDRYDEDNDRDQYGDMRARRRVEPHRGVVILVLGILSIVFFNACLVCWIVAAIAINMASTDVPKIDHGEMDISGRGMTVGGQACAYIGLLLSLLGCVLNGIIFNSMR